MKAPKKKGNAHHQASAASRAARRCAPSRAARAPQPVRKSRRLGGGGSGDCAEGSVVSSIADASVDSNGEKLLDQVEYLKLKGIEVDSIKSDGKFQVSVPAGWFRMCRGELTHPCGCASSASCRC